MNRLAVLPALWLLALCSPPAFADVKLPAVLGSHMVVQRDQPLTVWGWADKDEEVTVKFGDQSKSAKAGEKGDWKVVLPAPAMNAKPQTLTVAGKNTVELTDILVGDVWLGSGQSNMEWPLTATQKSKEAIAAATHANIRLLQIPKIQAKEPAKDVNAKWTECTPATAISSGTSLRSTPSTRAMCAVSIACVSPTACTYAASVHDRANSVDN